ncbi:MAG: class II fumarate hydratase [Planctomycetota bacterium]|nr:class II fumarate hydratase [Planctomycetota bacterium]
MSSTTTPHQTAASGTYPGKTRTEKDSMGELLVPEDVLYGASTQRAVLNFPVSGRPVPAEVIVAFAMLKAAAAEVNRDLGKLDADRAAAIVEACAQIDAGLASQGGIARHFPVDIFQTGSGTSTNMNANEVIANLVCVARGAAIGSSKDAAYLEAGGVHPNDHVNMGQSSNDTFPTAMNVALATAMQTRLLPAVQRMAAELEAKAQAWDRIVKIGRTHLQDATPIRLGQEFSGYAAQMRHAERRVARAIEALCPLALGGTAVGTGINTHREFGARVAAKLAERTGIAFCEAENHYEAQHSRDGVVEASGLLKTVAVSMSKIASDIRLMGCGPRCGIGELILPAVQPGSSIMPGKVNPVICESVMMVCCQVIGNDATTTTAGLGGIGGLLDLSVAMPVMVATTLDSVNVLAGACGMFVENLLTGLEPDEERCKSLIEGSLAMCTTLAPVIGYDKASALAKQAFAEGKTVRQVATEQALLPADELDRLLNPMSMTEPES